MVAWTKEQQQDRCRRMLPLRDAGETVFAGADPTVIADQWPAWCGGDAPAIGPDGWVVAPASDADDPEIVQRRAVQPETKPWSVRIEGTAPAGAVVIACWSIDETNSVEVARGKDGAVSLAVTRDGVETVHETGLSIAVGAKFRLGLALSAQRIAIALDGATGIAAEALRPIGLVMESLGHRWDATGAGGVIIAEIRFRVGLGAAALQEWTAWS